METFEEIGRNGMSMGFSNAKFCPAKMTQKYFFTMYHIFYIEVFHVIKLRYSENFSFYSFPTKFSQTDVKFALEITFTG